MSELKRIQRSVQLFSLMLVSGSGNKKRKNPINEWPRVLKQLAEHRDEATRIEKKCEKEGFHYMLPSVVEDAPLPYLGLGRRLNPSLTVDLRQGEEGGPPIFEDVADTDSFSLANASAVFFFPDWPGVIGFLRAHQDGSPSKKQLLQLLTWIYDPGKDQHWEISPIRVPSQIHELRTQALRARKFSATVSDSRDSLFDSLNLPDNAKGSSLVSLANCWAGRLGDAVEVSLTVQARGEKKNWRGGEKMLDFLRDEADRLSVSGAKIKAYAEVQSVGEVEERVLHLAEHELTVKIEHEFESGRLPTFAGLVADTARDLSQNIEMYLDGVVNLDEATQRID
ncbi:hypothetical protein [Dermabacter hominis]|uniref:hypothetical protein n=1 Tax=Dermabacter hominis TaxID=36740 RepID=UPI00117AAF3F|nr:hypothetical protein CYJ49_007690 [Dermabacter hominis]